MYKRSNIVKLNKKTICLIITLLSITLIASIVFTNKNNSNKNLDIPNLQIKSIKILKSNNNPVIIIYIIITGLSFYMTQKSYKVKVGNS